MEDKDMRGELLPIRGPPWQTTQEKKNRGGDAERKEDSAEEGEIEGGEEKVGNPLNYVLKPLCQAQTGNWRIHQPAPERWLCIQSLPSHPTAARSDRRPIRKGGKDEGQRE